ncbi:hypothetical protein BGX29_009909 [Mortierella sp. GBA35]|nr:hypothetical protein BGX29_009909 [Mortierella sp. GBA35]
MADRPLNEPPRILFNTTRIRSGQRNWSDPAPTTNRLDLNHIRAFAPAHYPRHYPLEIASDRTVAPIAAAVCRDIPLRPLPYRNGGGHPISNIGNSGNLGRHHHNSNIISSIHDLDLYEDDQHEYDAYATHPVPRLMRQAPKLLSLDDYNLISLGYKPEYIIGSINWGLPGEGRICPGWLDGSPSSAL